MSRKPESTFHLGVNRLLPASVYAEKMNNPYRGGTPDFYYEGPNGVLWIEYKVVDPFPPHLDLCQSGKLTRLQADWLWRAELNGVQCAVIVGQGQQGLVLQGKYAWSRPVERDHFREQASSRADIAAWITGRVT